MDQDSARRITEAFLAGSKDTLVSRMGITIVAAAAQCVVGTMPAVVITGDCGRRVCTSRLTCLLSDRVPGRGAHGPADIGAGDGAVTRGGA